MTISIESFSRDPSIDVILEVFENMWNMLFYIFVSKAIGTQPKS